MRRKIRQIYEKYDTDYKREKKIFKKKLKKFQKNLKKFYTADEVNVLQKNLI